MDYKIKAKYAMKHPMVGLKLIYSKPTSRHLEMHYEKPNGKKVVKKIKYKDLDYIL